ncbi:MAG: carboxypeptidase M32 [Thermoproteota archaeon]|nr:MAG: carboxypeptidase M32 [Candidatus Korarchaeota archaeon]
MRAQSPPAETPEVREILKRYREIWAVNYARALISWDMETYMPEAASRERGEVRAELSKMVQRLMTHPEFVSLVESARPANDFERGVVRVLKRDIEYYQKLPPEFVEEEARVTTEAFKAWEKAKEKSDFESFAPHLERVFDLQRRKAEYLGYEDHPYDALLDRYEEGLTVRDCERIFSVAGELSDLFKKVRERYPERHPLEDEGYDRRDVERLNRHVLTLLGFDFSRGRVDVSAHPFTQEVGLYDVRITTWYHGRDFRRSLLAAVHEFGHAAYEMNVDESYWATPVQGGVSYGVHESQSRFWENVVARSRAYVETLYWDMRAVLPFLSRYSPEEVYEYFTLVRPELIRVEADEVHYPLHVYLRYRIEKMVMEEAVGVGELPQLWGDMMEELVGVRPEKDSEGVLQDVHWSLGYVGYFPTYAIGSFLAAQVARALGRVEERVRARDFSGLMAWLRERVHRWGSVYPPRELIRRATGEDLNPERFLEYLREKYLA